MTVDSEIAFDIPELLNRPLSNLRRGEINYRETWRSLTVIEAFVRIIRIITNSLVKSVASWLPDNVFEPLGTREFFVDLPI